MVGVDDVAVFVIESAVEIAPYVILFYPPCSQEVKTQITFFFYFLFFFLKEICGLGLSRLVEPTQQEYISCYNI
jgi:hypothetical protein